MLIFFDHFDPLTKKLTFWLIPILLGTTFYFYAFGDLFARTEIGVFSVKILYPSKTHKWLSLFIQDELTRQFVLNGRFSVLPVETIKNWQQKLHLVSPYRFTSHEFSQMKLHLAIEIAVQKVLQQVKISWTLHVVKNKVVESLSYQSDHSWKTPDHFLSSLCNILSKQHSTLKEFGYFPQNFTWAGVSAFYETLDMAPNSPRSPKWNEYKSIFESHIIDFPHLAHVIRGKLAKMLIMESSLSPFPNTKILEQAEIEIKEALRIAPKNDEYHTMLALIYHLKGVKYLAKAEAVVANANNPHNGVAWILYGMNIGKQIRLGDQFIKKGIHFYPFLTKDSPSYRLYSGLIPDLKPWEALMVSSESIIYKKHLLEGKRLFNQRKWEFAQLKFKKTLSVFSDQIEPHIYLARIEIVQNKLTEAQTHLEILAEKHPDQDQIFLYLGFIQEKLNNYSEAEKYYRKSLELKLANPMALLRLGTILVKTNKHMEAESFLESLTKKYPDFPNGWKTLGRLYSQLKKSDKAVDAFQEALRLKPKDARLKRYLLRAKKKQDLNTAQDIKMID